MNLFPKQIGDVVILQATFAFNHLQPSKRTICILLAQPNSPKPRLIGYPADNDELALMQLLKSAHLEPADAEFLITAAHETQKEFERQAKEFIPAGALT